MRKGKKLPRCYERALTGFYNRREEFVLICVINTEQDGNWGRIQMKLGEKKTHTLVGLSGRGGESALWVHLWKSRLLEETTSKASYSFSGCSREWARKHPFNGGSRSGLEDHDSMAAP